MPSSLFGPRMQTGQSQSQVPAQQANTGFQLPPNFRKLKALMNLAQNGGNVQSLVQNAVAEDPNGNMVMNLIQKHNGNAQAAFYDLAAQKGADPNQILKLMR